MIRRAAPLLLLLCACEDNEHPFGDTWAISCGADGAPGMSAAFNTPTRLDDAGRRREYLGRVDVAGPGFTDTWLWQVEVDTWENTATTVELVRVPTPDEYIRSGQLQDLRLDVATYVEAEDTTFADMTGTCAWGATSGPLTMHQSDDCDLCPDCSTLTVLPTGGGALFVVGLLLRRRRRAA